MALGGDPPSSGRPALVKIGGPEQVASSGPKRVKVTVPLGVGIGGGPAKTVAVSEMGPPRGAVGVALVVMTASTTTAIVVSPGALQGLETAG